MKFFNFLPFPELLMHGFRLVPLNSLSISLQGSNYDLTFSTCLPDLFLVYIDRLNRKFIWSVIRYVHVSFNEFLNINFSLFITLYGFCSYIYILFIEFFICTKYHCRKYCLKYHLSVII